jgi:hypothetical protein
MVGGRWRPQWAQGAVRRVAQPVHTGAVVDAKLQGRRRPQREQVAVGSLKQFTHTSGEPSRARRPIGRTFPQNPQGREEEMLR